MNGQMNGRLGRWLRGERARDAALIALLFWLPLMMFWPQTVGGRTLLPTENLYQYEPYRTYREVVKAPEIPHNHLLDDLVLQNYQWKSFIRSQLAAGEIPLWNPHQFSGIAFMAAGQQSTLYPLSLIYYLLPLPAAYGWFTVVNLWLAGAFMFAYGRGIGLGRFGAAVAGVSYQLAGTFIASAVHPMILGAAVWLPALLLLTEYIVRGRTLFGRPARPVWAALGAVALACNVTAGHVEIMIYTLLILGYYAAARLAWAWWQERRDAGVPREAMTRGGYLAAMVALGLGLAAVQLVPLYEAAGDNWRAERADFATVLSYAHPPRDLLAFALPNFYGSPAHHHYFDVFALQTRPVDFVNAAGERRVHTEWGVKNYVEGALYLGVLPLIFAAYALGVRLFRPRVSVTASPAPYAVPIFAPLAALSLTFMFGLPSYALVYALPGVNQLNSPFRWIFALTVCVAALAGVGADALASRPRAARRVGLGMIGAGAAMLIALLLSRVFWANFEPLVERLWRGMAGAENTFADAAMFYSYQFGNVFVLGLVLMAGGVALTPWPPLPQGEGGIKSWRQIAVIGVIAGDLMLASWGFNPASDPALLDFVPPAIQWLRDQPGEWRYAVVNGGGADILRANMTLAHGLDDITGYESIIPAAYVDYMRGVRPQDQLIYNRIAPFYASDNAADIGALLLSPRVHRLNVRFVITHKNFTFDERWLRQDDSRSPAPIALAYEDEAVRIWRLPWLPRAYTLNPGDASSLSADTALGGGFHHAAIRAATTREKFVEVASDGATWLIVSESYAPGWRAYVRPQGAGESAERAVTVERVQGNFQGVYLPDAGRWTVRLIYSPVSFQVGAFGSVISAAALVLLLAMWAWGQFVARPDDGEAGAASRLARNSLAPILLNLFNRGIDFVFASVMFRILGPEDAGFYYYAIVVFGWFDIFTNFGLDLYLMREAGRARERAAALFSTTTALRLGLVAAAVPLLLAFLSVRQASAEPLNADVLLTIALFYVGLIPGSASKGLTSLFYAFERAEYPAAVTTITTMAKVALGMGALLLGAGIVGLAGVSIVTNLVTLAALLVGARRLIAGLRPARPEGGAMRAMLGGSWPLMVNHFLATVFFQIDIVILEWLRDARTVGLYRVAYSWLLAINVVPAFFTQALMARLSRQARDDRAAFRRTYTLAVKLLVMTALPLAVGFTFLAEPLTWLLGGSAYLPDGALALQLMIWSIPVGWMNSLTQYALIALELQRRVTLAFALAVAFNLTTNLIFIPQYGYQAAAITTILSEMVLWLPFARLLGGAVSGIDWLGIVVRPAGAAALMFATLWIGWPVAPALALPLAGVVYLGALAALRPFSADEWATLAPLLPRQLRRAAS